MVYLGFTSDETNGRAVADRSLLSGGGCRTALMTAGERAARGLMGARGSRRPSLERKPRWSRWSRWRVTPLVMTNMAI